MGGWKRSCCCIGAAPGCACGCRNLYDSLCGSCSADLTFVWEAPDGCLLHVESAHPLKLAFLKVSSAAAAWATSEVALVAWRIQAGLAGKDQSWKLIKQNKTLSVWVKTLNALSNILTYSGWYLGLSNLKDVWQVNFRNRFETIPF